MENPAVWLFPRTAKMLLKFSKTTP